MLFYADLPTVLLLWCLLLIQFSVGQNPGTKFTKEPPNTVFGILDSDVIFHWRFAFGDTQDRSDFNEIVWGATSNNARINNKYVTVNKYGSHAVNNGLPSPLHARLDAKTNISQRECSVMFVLKRSIRTDEGITYGCEAEVDGVDFRSGPIRLVLQILPTITSSSNSTIDVEEGEDVQLLCDAAGDPKPFMKWMNSGVLLQRSNSSKDLLLIRDIELKDGGNYVCTAANQAGAVSHSIHVRVVRYRPYINRTASSNPVVKSWLNHITGLKCAVDASPTANFTWFKDHRPVLSGVNSTHDISTLTLTPHSAGDFGLYLCKATNIKGTAWYNITVEQLYPPSSPMIDKLAADIQTITLTWNASLDNGGSPILDYMVTLLDANDNVQQKPSGVRGHNYTLQSLKHNRTYKIFVQARNVAGYGKSANATVSTLEADPPSVLSITTVPSFTAVNISWNSTNDNTGINILDYRVVLTDTITHKQREFKEINASTLCIKELKQNRTYIVHVQARNEDGYGRFNTRNFTTLEADPPRILSITAVPSFVSVSISWNSTNDNTGIQILDYKVILTDTVTKHKREFISINVSSLYVAKLRHNRTYTIEVQARNEDGFGKFKSRNFTTFKAGPPSPPIIKAFPRVLALYITWNASLQDINNPKILSYRIKVSSGTSVIRQLATITETSLEIKNLARNRTYVIEIKARNVVGFGQSAEIRATTLSAGPPGAPSITNITVKGKLCILQWTKPYNGESPVKLYTVSVWLLLATNGSYYTEKLQTWNTTDTKYSLNLEWNQNYTAAVSAWNKYGQSSYGLERQFRAERFRSHELSSTTATESMLSTPSTTEDVSSSKDSPTSQTEHNTVNQVRTRESGANKEKKQDKNSFIYLAPLWIVVLAFAIPAVLFMFWKGTQKALFVRCCRRRPSPREFHNRDSESSETSMEEVREKTSIGHYETITEIVETHFNHGCTSEDENENKPPTKAKSAPEPDNVYDHLHETSLGPGLGVQQTTQNTEQVGPFKPTNELTSGLGMFPDHVYCHLTHTGAFVKRPATVRDRHLTTPPKRRWEISRDRLKLDRTIGCGEFGLVKKGLALNVTKSGGWVPVAVKTLRDNDERNDLCRKALLSDLKAMKDLPPHKHVIQLFGCITESEPLCVITEFPPYGDLLGFLRKKRGLRDNYYSVDRLPRRSLTPYQLMQFAWEIADGMDYLNSAKIIHRDLAARNVLLGDNLMCKVTDFGMARDIRGQDMYQKNTGGRLPVKWTAIEALIHGLYTTKSDVWSFGVVLFEIVTIGGNPYPGMEVLELIDRLESGYRMEKPRHVADEVYDLMLSCWNEDPDKRPTFRQLYRALKQLAKGNQACINLKDYEGRLYENFQMS